MVNQDMMDKWTDLDLCENLDGAWAALVHFLTGKGAIADPLDIRHDIGIMQAEMITRQARSQ